MANHINVANDFVCVCLSLGGGSCRRFPFHCLTFDETHFTEKRKCAHWEIKKVLKGSD
ncbi:hypothetical protein A2U01_0074341, partial [Trifolium medium]|nr:hypothetical protein [Trifolium medium]